MPGDGSGNHLITKEPHKGILEVTELFRVLIMVVDTCLFALVNRAVHPKKRILLYVKTSI